MNDSTPDIVRFLNSVLRTRDGLRDVYSHYVRRNLKVHWGTNLTGPAWTDSYIEYGLIVTGSDGRIYELSARLRWPGDEWIVEGEVSLEEEDAAGSFRYATLRELPRRSSKSWERAAEDFSDAVAELIAFDDLIPTADERAG